MGSCQEKEVMAVGWGHNHEHPRAAGEPWTNSVDQRSWLPAARQRDRSPAQWHQGDDGLAKPHHQIHVYVSNAFFSNPAYMLPLHH